MATRKKKKKRNSKKQTQTLVGIGALCASLAVLLFLGFSLSRLELPQTLQVPETTAAPTTEPTLPPPEANPYGPLDFQYDGWYLSCLAGKSVLGLDVSYYQKEVDWQAVRDAGFEFVIIRVGYRGFSAGELTPDTHAQLHYEGAKAAGLKIGAYLFSQAVSVEEAEEEADFLLAAIADWEVDMPVVFDWEYVSDTARTALMDARTLTDCTIAFCERVEAAGYEPMVYFNRNQGYRLLHLEELTDYGFWLALYNDRMTYPYKIDMWQYTSTGTVPGIEGDVDINLWFPE